MEYCRCAGQDPLQFPALPLPGGPACPFVLAEAARQQRRYLAPASHARGEAAWVCAVATRPAWGGAACRRRWRMPCSPSAARPPACPACPPCCSGRDLHSALQLKAAGSDQRLFGWCVGHAGRCMGRPCARPAGAMPLCCWPLDVRRACQPALPCAQPSAARALLTPPCVWLPLLQVWSRPAGGGRHCKGAQLSALQRLRPHGQ